MKKLYLLSLFYLCLAPLSAQKNNISEGAESITIAELRDHMFYLASDELEGRKSGTAGYDKAAQYVVTQLRQAGLSPVCKNEDSTLSYYQEFFIDKYSPGLNNSITIVKDDDKRIYSFEDNFLINYGGPFETKELSGGLVFVGAGIKEPEYGIDDYKDLDVKGKWAVMLEDMPAYIRKKLPKDVLQKYLYHPENERLIAERAKDAGAIGLILIPDSFNADEWEMTATAYHDFNTLPGIGQFFLTSELPTVIIDSSMIDFLFSREKYNPLRNKEQYKSFVFRNSVIRLQKEYNLSTIRTANVVALIEGSDPVLKNEYITLCGHLDHMGIWHSEVMNGADDNASGSAGVLEIAEALAKSKPKRSIICILCAGEELGLLGSSYFTENPPVPLNNIIVNINLDMIGSSDTDIKALAPIGAGRITPKLKEVISKVSEREQYVPIDWAYADSSRYVNMSDHYPFHLKKIPPVFFFSGDNADIHMPTDDPEKIDYGFFQKSCRLVYEIVMELANGMISLKD